uniref:G protein-coupled receptor n=1 Tax=Plectus sambesii TaxID=2011161 RepID=A0A914VMJ0_9BILA
MATIPIINIVEGSSIAALNSLLVLSILSEKTLRQRKELILITGMAIADALYGLGCIDSGRDKFAQLARSNVTDYTPLHCFFKPKELLINYASQTSLLTMIAISGERLTAIVWFNSYGLIPRRYHCSILFLAYFIPMCTMFAGAYQAYLLTITGILAIVMGRYIFRPLAIRLGSYAITDEEVARFGRYL